MGVVLYYQFFNFQYEDKTILQPFYLYGKRLYAHYIETGCWPLQYIGSLQNLYKKSEISNLSTLAVQ